MDDLTTYESRIGRATESSSKIFRFITDMRNLKRFLPGKAIENWEADQDSCSFEVSPVGRSEIKIERKDPDTQVKYRGHGLNNTDFNLWIQLKELQKDDTRVKITIKAGLNPMIKMMAARPIKQFLDKLIDGIENFDDWDNVSG